METKKQIFKRYKKEYFKAKVEKKGGRKILARILGTVCEVTGIKRKSAIRKFNNLQTKDSSVEERRGRPLLYTPDVTSALKEVWEEGGEVCGELTKPIIREYVSIFQRDGEWNHSDEATGKAVCHERRNGEIKSWWIYES